MSSRILSGGLPILLLLCTFLAFWPGLSGGFWLDDHGVLPVLFKSVSSEGFWPAVLGGSTGPLGRPLSLISFAFQHESWPYAHDFILVNMLIHLVNTTLVYTLCKTLLKFIDLPKSLAGIDIGWLALLVAFVWAVAPLQVSTVLYVVQRMVLLFSLFVLLALNVYLWALSCSLKGREVCAVWGVIIGCGGLGVLGLLAKETAFTLVIYMLLLRYVLRDASSSKTLFFRWFVPSVLWISCGLFLLYVLLQLEDNLLPTYGVREFSLSERLLTQSIIHWQYIRQLLIPELTGLGLFNDDYPISKGLFEPVTTGWALLAWLVVGGLTWIAHRRNERLLVFGVLWFIGGHILEGTVWPLELYFEHRNYLPALGLWLLVVVYGVVIFKSVTSKAIKMGLVLATCLYLAFIVGVTLYTTNLWGKPRELSLIYAAEHPKSIRARSAAVDAYRELGMIESAYKELEGIESDFPKNLAPHLIKVEFACLYPDKFNASVDKVSVERAKQAKFSNGTLLALQELISGDRISRTCKVFKPVDLIPVMKALLVNKEYAGKAAMLHQFMMIIYRNSGEIETALYWLQQSARDSYDSKLAEVQLLAALSRPQEALLVLGELEKFHIPVGLNDSQRAYLKQLNSALKADESKLINK